MECVPYIHCKYQNLLKQKVMERNLIFLGQLAVSVTWKCSVGMHETLHLKLFFFNVLCNWLILIVWYIASIGFKLCEGKNATSHSQWYFYPVWEPFLHCLCCFARWLMLQWKWVLRKQKIWWHFKSESFVLNIQFNFIYKWVNVMSDQHLALIGKTMFRLCIIVIHIILLSYHLFSISVILSSQNTL